MNRNERSIQEQNWFQLSDLVYLSPDATEFLTEVDSSKVYVIGGLVDETVHKKVTSKGSRRAIVLPKINYDFDRITMLYMKILFVQFYLRLQELFQCKTLIRPEIKSLVKSSFLRGNK